MSATCKHAKELWNRINDPDRLCDLQVVQRHIDAAVAEAVADLRTVNADCLRIMKELEERAEKAERRAFRFARDGLHHAQIMNTEPGKHAEAIVRECGRDMRMRDHAGALWTAQQHIDAAVAEAILQIKADETPARIRIMELDRRLEAMHARAGKAEAAGAEAVLPCASYRDTIDRWSHEWKQLRQHMGCDGSDLPQLMAAWDALKERAEKAEAELAEWEAERKYCVEKLHRKGEHSLCEAIDHRLLEFQEMKTRAEKAERECMEWENNP